MSWSSVAGRRCGVCGECQPGVPRLRQPLWVRNGPSATPPGRSAAGGQADEIGAKADIETRRSAIGGKADVPATWPESPLLAKSSPLEKLMKLQLSGRRCRNLALCDAGGRSRSQHHDWTHNKANGLHLPRICPRAAPARHYTAAQRGRLSAPTGPPNLPNRSLVRHSVTRPS